MSATFQFKPGDASVDPAYELRVSNEPVIVAVQDCTGHGGGYIVNEYGPDADSLEWLEARGTFPTLAEAQDVALIVYRERRAAAAQQ